MIEHSCHPVENRRQILQRENSVVKIGHSTIHCYRGDILLLLRYTRLYRRYEIGYTDILKRGNTIFIGIFRQEWIL